MQTNSADTINDILRGVMERGGFGSALALDKPSAGKTGTINSNMAVWFDGYTPALATASMIAGANGEGHWVTLNGQTIGGQYVASAHGSTNAGPMWADAMRAIQDDLPDLDFVKPIKTQESRDLSIVPNVVGMTPADAQATLQRLGFVANVVSGQFNSDLPVGLVALTSPAAGSTVYDGSTISLYISGGPAPATTGPPGGGGGGGPPTFGPSPTATSSPCHGRHC